MKFAIAETSYFQSIGFDTTHWRKNLDETESICHAEFALTLADEEKLDIYDFQSDAFKARINGEGWVEQIEEPLEENKFEK